VFGVGLSEGGYMAIRLALQAPSRFRAVAPVAANLSAPENFLQAGHARGRVCHSDPRHQGPPRSIRRQRGKPLIRPLQESQSSFITRDGTILCGP
jgi:poly(3-hydroxybutyrate) depolymerase